MKNGALGCKLKRIVAKKSKDWREDRKEARERFKEKKVIQGLCRAKLICNKDNNVIDQIKLLGGYSE
jgi:hypothetical protein